jgi:hypothetical protein
MHVKALEQHCAHAWYMTTLLYVETCTGIRNKNNNISATCSAIVTDTFLYRIQIIICKLISGLFKGSYSCKEYDFIFRRPF